MIEISSYPTVYNIGHAAVQDLFFDDVIVEEKIDGSQFSFVKTEGVVHFRSKGAIVYPESAGIFKAAVDAVLEAAPSLPEKWVFRGEYLAKPHHNVLTYGRVPLKHVIIFDINVGDEIYMPQSNKIEYAKSLGFETVPKLFSGRVGNPQQLLDLLEIESVLGNTKIEGIVAKNYSRFGRDKKVLMGKFVSEKFKETHNKEWKASNPILSDVVDKIIATLRTERRWEKAVEHLRDRGELESSPRDIGKLIAEVRTDILKEEKEFIKDKLYEWAKDRISRASAAGVAEWYKTKLLTEAFPENSSETYENI